MNKISLGLEAAELVEHIMNEQPDGTNIAIIEIPAVPVLQDRFSLSSEEISIITEGQQLRATSALSFWDSVLLSTFGARHLPFQILRGASFHNNAATNRIVAAKDSYTAEDVRNLFSSLPPGHMLAFLSRLTHVDGTVCHVPLLDFHCPISDQNLRLAIELIRILDTGPGWILESGKSYHFYGQRVIAADELSRFLGRSLLFSPIVDRAWIAHQLIEGACALRVSPKFSGDRPPYVVARLQ